MRSLLPRVAMGMLLFSTVIPGAALADAPSAPIDRQLGKTFLFQHGFTIRVNSISTVSRPDATPLSAKYLKDVNTQDGAKGYVVVQISLQDVADPGWRPDFSFQLEYEDGSQMDEAAPEAVWVGTSLAPAPGSMYTKQHLELTYILGNWSGQPITKLFIHNGEGWARFQIPPNYVKSIA